jgi:hypothetical protein
VGAAVAVALAAICDNICDGAAHQTPAAMAAERPTAGAVASLRRIYQPFEAVTDALRIVAAAASAAADAQSRPTRLSGPFRFQLNHYRERHGFCKGRCVDF